MVNMIIEKLKFNKELTVKVYNGLNSVGKEYFKHGYMGEDITPDNDSEIDDIQEFIIFRDYEEYKRILIEDMGCIEPDIWDKTVALDDSYRHSAILRIEDFQIMNPCNIPLFAEYYKNREYFDDYCFTWKAVEELGAYLLQSGFLLIHMDMDSFYFPIPSL